MRVIGGRRSPSCGAAGVAVRLHTRRLPLVELPSGAGRSSLPLRLPATELDEGAGSAWGLEMQAKAKPATTTATLSGVVFLGGVVVVSPTPS
ncbi:hypothetical protein C2845_PM08G21110 [Panicum miliaceum]|uniref:Uncharacterized protein n=1 Tax=Panicum miliaceum TaxID=4540 RepID=A0A3L6QYA5_PANMI|nr:hypothetical protein C2845_PM08G21110 [Panicum miliaceum]